MATIIAAAGGGDWNTGASWVGGVAPTAADDAQVPLAAGNMSIGSGAVCRSADFSTYTGTLSGTGTLTIGDATAGLSSIALKLVSGMTVSGPPAFSFISTSATVQTVDFAGKTTGAVSFNATSNGSWQYTGAHTVGAAVTVTLTKGTLDINGQTCSWGLFDSSSGNTRSLTLGAAAITLTGSSTIVWNIANITGLTFSGASSTLTANGDTAEISPGSSQAYGTLNLTGSGVAKLNSTAASFATLNRTGTASKFDGFNINGAKTVTGVLTLAGNSAINRLLVFSHTLGTAAVITNVGATMTWSNVDFQDISLGTSFDASAITGLSGDCGGNTNITFTTTATQTYTGGTDSWSTAARWTSRVPLPQDNILMSGVTGGTITADMPRLGKGIDWTGASGTPVWTNGTSSSSFVIFGSVTLISAMSMSAGGNIWQFSGRGNFTITSSGVQWANSVSFIAPSGVHTLQDAFSTIGTLTMLNGTFDANGFNVTASTFTSNSGTITRAITMGTGTWTSINTGGSTIWNTASTTGLTFSGASSTFVISGTTASTRVFSGGGLTFGTLTYTVAGSTGQLSMIGSNTFTTINFSDASNARSLLFTAGTTTTIINSFNVQGTATKLMTIGSITASGHTLSKSSGTVSCDYLSISRSTAQGGAAWYAGANSTDGGNNSGWIFTAAPTTGGSGNQGATGLQSLANLQNLRAL